MNKTFTKFCRMAVTVLMVSILLTLFFTVSAENEYPGKIESVTLNKDGSRVTVNARIDKDFVSEHSGETLCLFRLPPNNNPGDLSGLEPIAVKEMSAALSKTENFTKQLLYSSYVLALQNADGTYDAISNNVYIENPEAVAINSADYPVPATKKGLSAQISADAQYLGAAHTTIDVEIEDYISPVKTDNTLSHTFFGQTFYINESKLSALDHKVKVYSDAGMNVYLNIVLGKTDSADLDFLYLNRESGSSLYAIDTSNTKSARHFASFCEFIVNRYSTGDGKYGFVPAYILGYEVNAAGKWGYLADNGLGDYVKSYENAYRILYNAVRSTYCEGKVFVSVSNLFNSDESASDFGAREFLSAFAEEINTGGKAEWSLAINPYASDAGITEFWNDEAATDSDDTKYVTMKNLDVLCEFMEQESMLNDGKVRDIIISEFGIHGDSSNADSLERQAAAYALAYAVADTNPHIDAFIYYRHIDHPAEPQKFGLWSTGAASTAIPQGKKAVYQIFRDADTANFAKGLEMAKSYCTTELYNKYLKDYTPKVKRVVTEAVSVSSIPSKYKETVLYDLTGGSLWDFYPSDSSAYVELRPVDSQASYTSLYSVLKPVSSQTYMGISRTFAEDEKLSGDYITLSFKPITPVDQTLTVLLRLDAEVDGVNHVFEAVSQLSSNTQAMLTFKMSDYIKLTDGNINSLRLWYKPSNAELEAGEYGLWLNKISVHTTTGVGNFFDIIASIIPWLIAAALIGGIVYIYKNKHILNKIKEIVGKTRSRFLNFLRNKKIISGKYRKKKRSPGSQNEKQNTQNQNTPAKSQNVRRESPVRIVNGRVITPSSRHTVQNERTRTQNLQNAVNVQKTTDKDESSGKKG